MPLYSPEDREGNVTGYFPGRYERHYGRGYSTNFYHTYGVRLSY